MVQVGTSWETIEMNFNQLHIEFNQYWSNRNYQSAILNLQSIDNFISNGQMDTFLVSYNHILEPEYLLSLYSVQTNQDMTIIINQIHYNDLINWFSHYLQSLINEIVDYQKKLQAQTAKSNFDKILDSVSNVLSFISNPVILSVIGLLLVITFIPKSN